MAAVERKLSESERKLVKANERINNQQKAHIEALQNKNLIEEKLKQENEELRKELNKERNFRHNRQQNNGNDPEESPHPCSWFSRSWSWFSRSQNSESKSHLKIHWDQGNRFLKFNKYVTFCM